MILWIIFVCGARAPVHHNTSLQLPVGHNSALPPPSPTGDQTKTLPPSNLLSAARRKSEYHCATTFSGRSDNVRRVVRPPVTDRVLHIMYAIHPVGRRRVYKTQTIRFPSGYNGYDNTVYNIIRPWYRANNNIHRDRQRVRVGRTLAVVVANINKCLRSRSEMVHEVVHGKHSGSMYIALW